MVTRCSKGALLAALLAAAFAFTASARADEHPAGKAAPASGKAEHPKAKTETKLIADPAASGMGMPMPSAGPEHAVLQKSAGKWNASIKMMGMPGGEPMMMQGTEDVTSVCNGMFIEVLHKGTDAKMPFEGHGLEGYDQVKKMYTGTWCDSWGTGMMTYEGTADAKGVLTYTCTMANPESGKVENCKMQCSMPDNNTRTMKMWKGTDMTAPPMMEITYTRAGTGTEAARK